MMKNKINITYKFVDMYTVTKVAEAFVLVTVPFYNGLLYYRGAIIKLWGNNKLGYREYLFI